MSATHDSRARRPATVSWGCSSTASTWRPAISDRPSDASSRRRRSWCPKTPWHVDPQADWYATPDETKDGLIDLAHRVWVFSDTTISELPLDTPGRVPWWPAERRKVTLLQIIVHVTYDLARHAGQADIMREQHDAAIGCQPASTMIPDGYDWPAYVAKLTALADRFGAQSETKSVRGKR